MAKTKSKSRRKPGSTPIPAAVRTLMEKKAAQGRPAAPPPPATLHEAVEFERTQIMQVEAMLSCLYEVLLYADDEDSIMHADVAQVGARLLGDISSRLDIALIKHFKEQAAPAGADPSSPTTEEQTNA